jgi:hypothetical protein
LARNGPFSDTFVVDTKFAGGSLKFEALDSDAAYYKWYLGLDTIEGPDMKVVSRDIFNLPLGSYPSTLIVEKQADNQCFPNDNGIDTVSQQFVKVSVCDLEIINKFEGVFEEAPNDTVAIELLMWNKNQNTFCSYGATLYAVNFLGQGDTLSVSRLENFTNTWAYWPPSPITVNDMQGQLRVDDENNVSADYQLFERKKKFKGTIKK